MGRRLPPLPSQTPPKCRADGAELANQGALIAMVWSNVPIYSLKRHFDGRAEPRTFRDVERITPISILRHFLLRILHRAEEAARLAHSAEPDSHPTTLPSSIERANRLMADFIECSFASKVQLVALILCTGTLIGWSSPRRTSRCCSKTNAHTRILNWGA